MSAVRKEGVHVDPLAAQVRLQVGHDAFQLTRVPQGRHFPHRSPVSKSAVSTTRTTMNLRTTLMFDGDAARLARRVRDRAAVKAWIG